MSVFWEEDEAPQANQPQSDAVDLSFQIRCRSLPVDHASALSAQVLAYLPWLETEVLAGIHQIHVAASGNGWYRPEEGGDALLYLSRRTRLILRVPRGRSDEAQALSGRRLEIEGHALEVGKAQVKPISASPTLYARYVLSPYGEDEERFLQESVESLRALGLRVRKALCGKSHRIRTMEEPLYARSLMLADLSVEDSLTLQDKGLGPGRLLGCGLFIPHKGIDAVKKTADEDKP